MEGDPKQLRAELEAARSEIARLRTVEDLVAIAPAFLGFVSLDGVILSINDLALQAIDARRDQVIGTVFWDAGWWSPLPDSAARVREAVSDAAHGTPTHTDLEYWAIVGSRGSRRWLALDIGPIRDAAGTIVRIGVSGIDITERVAAREALSRSRALAAETSERLQGLFMQSPVAIAVVVGPDHRFELANQRYLELTRRAEIVGMTIAEAFPEIVGTSVLELFDHVFRTGEPYSTDEYKLALERNGALEHLVFAFNLVPTRDRGVVTGIMCAAQEITDQVNSRAALIESTQRLQLALDARRVELGDAERANLAKDEFLAVLGHELRNPLAPILTALELMRLRSDDQPDAERTVIERQAHHLVRLVDDLLDVSRITTGKIELKLQRVELSEVVATAIEMASPLLEELGHELTVDIAARGLVLDADPARLAQVLSNLLTNAAKYSEGHGRIAIAAARIGGEISIGVRDHGIGIAPDMLPKIFEFFVQEPQALDRARGGLGLGLAIVHNLVALHGGRVEARSAGRNQGAELIVTLPAATVENPVRHSAARRSTSQSGEHGRRILVIDDNVDAAELMAVYLETRGHTTLVAHDGPSALKLVHGFAPDIALLDIGLPVMDGYELARRLRDDSELQALKLIAVTGYGQATDRAKSRAVGFNAHLVKPVKMEQLLAAIEEISASPPTSSRS